MRKKTWAGLAVALLVAILVVVVWIASRVDVSNGSRKTLRIGAILPLTGDIASYGTRVKLGAEIACNELEKKELPPIEIEFQDDQDSARNAVGIMKTFCAVKHYPAVIGAAGSSVSLAIVPIANEYKVVQLSPLSSAGNLATQGGQYFFRVCPADDQQARILATWVAAKKYARVAVIYTNNAWGLGLAEAFKAYYENNLHGKVALFEGTAEGQTDFRTVLTKAKAEGCKAIVSPTYPKDGGLLVRQAKELGLDCDMFGADNWGAPEFTQIAGTAAKGCFFVAQYSYDGPAFKNLNSTFKSQTGKDADVFVAYGYDSVYAIAHAAKSAKSWQGTDICDALRSVRFQGASGLVEFDEHGNLRTDAFVKKVIQDGKPMPLKESSK
jgi:branched-chain amino acid transport system substrate-binding protein